MNWYMKYYLSSLIAAESIRPKCNIVYQRLSRVSCQVWCSLWLDLLLFIFFILKLSWLFSSRLTKTLYFVLEPSHNIHGLNYSCGIVTIIILDNCGCSYAIVGSVGAFSTCTVLVCANYNVSKATQRFLSIVILGNRDLRVISKGAAYIHSFLTFAGSLLMLGTIVFMFLGLIHIKLHNMIPLLHH